ncbi:HlyD family efflux transporter periplasmic adaptor subunit [Clostridium sp. MCC353]|uniref:HlyD family efflux transporter periplasmic adaptor subunit n=1 Tax=Clostridium sp. MCC353 TaxID=2592646 RepID=UPI001C02D673|nr:HlyD family efflux transporter periplasmic adaptor subunit [Clostridium sp. MCC353]MBT9779322.1 HlyD family efflux transporter periplasmic adaptor subunit [Clostridium sp. MCC353]
MKIGFRKKEGLPKTETRQNRRNRKKGSKKIMVIVLALTAAAAVVVVPKALAGSKKASAGAETVRTAAVTKGSITSELSSSGTISPKDTYEITSLVEGEIIAADFEEGGQVEKGQVLYQIDVSSMETELKSAANSLERAQANYDVAVEDYNEAQEKYGGNIYKSTRSGFITKLNIQSGDKVGADKEIASIYNDLTMKLKVPFLATEAVLIPVGSQGTITLTDTMEQLAGVVTAVSNMDETLTGGRLVRYVTVETANPGGLTAEHWATVAVGDFLSAAEGQFEAALDTSLKCDLSSSVEVEALLVNEGDYVTVGTPIFRIAAKDAEKLIRSYKDAMDKAEETLESAQSKVDTTQDSYEDYTITAPISGQVITKTSKVGDNVSRNSSNSTVMAVIYDLSEVTFEMSIDELDVQKVKVGQKVEVTADAIENQTFTGTVTNVSLQSSYSNGVTNYPVTVTLDEVGSLLPGMNVDGRIILDEADDVLLIPVGALMRGTRVYIKDETVTEAQGTVPAGFRSVEVETGLVNDDYVEVISGLSEGDTVYLSESSGSSATFMMPGMQGGMPQSGGMPGGSMPGGQGGGQRQGGSQRQGSGR